MKCSNCGADLKIDGSRMLKFCPYCGQEIEMEEKEPETMAGAISSIARSLLSQRAEQKRYEREHAHEIAEEKRKDRQDEQKHNMKMFFILMGGLAVIVMVLYLVMRATGAFTD